MLISFPASRTTFVAKTVTDWDNDMQPGGTVEVALNQLAKRIKLIENITNEIREQGEAILIELRITNKYLGSNSEDQFTEDDLEERG